MDKQRYEEYLDKMRAYASSEDHEWCHPQADGLLAEFVEELGYPELAEAYNEVPAWYA